MNQTTENQTKIGQTETAETAEMSEPGAIPKRTRVLKPNCKHCGAKEADHVESLHTFEPRPRGFGAMTKEQRAALASRGGKAAHVAGTAHKWTSEEAKVAGLAGGKAPHVRRGPPRGKRRNPSNPPDNASANHMITNTVEVNTGNS